MFIFFIRRVFGEYQRYHIKAMIIMFFFFFPSSGCLWMWIYLYVLRVYQTHTYKLYVYKCITTQPIYLSCCLYDNRMCFGCCHTFAFIKISMFYGVVWVYSSTYYMTERCFLFIKSWWREIEQMGRWIEFSRTSRRYNINQVIYLIIHLKIKYM